MKIISILKKVGLTGLLLFSISLLISCSTAEIDGGYDKRGPWEDYAGPCEEHSRKVEINKTTDNKAIAPIQINKDKKIKITRKDGRYIIEILEN